MAAQTSFVRRSSALYSQRVRPVLSRPVAPKVYRPIVAALLGLWLGLFLLGAVLLLPLVVSPPPAL